MSQIMMDTDKVKSDGQSLMNLSKNLNEQLNGLFRVLENLDKIGAWKGQASQLYSSKVKIDKSQYYVFKNSVYRDGKNAFEIASYMETEMRKLI